MTTPGELHRPAALPSLGELLARFVRRQASSGVDVLDLLGETAEVIPHQPSGLLGPDARTVLADALEAASTFLPPREAAAFDARGVRPPADWASILRAQETTVAIPMCVGNCPQLVRDATPLLGAMTVDALLPKPMQPLDASALQPWIDDRITKKRLGEALFGVGLLRLAGHFDAARDALVSVASLTPSSWDGLLRNEEAAIAWHRGDVKAAALRWAKHPNQDSPAILFNRGLAAMCLEQPIEATGLLEKAANALPEKSPWHHLARLYLTLNEVI